MKRTLFIIILATCLASLCKAQGTGGEAIWVNLPFYSDSTASYYPDKYGMIDAYDRIDPVDHTYFPPIPGLRFRSCLEMCPKDSCEAKRAVLAVSCPNDKILLKWASQKACDFTNRCIEDSMQHICPDLSLTSGEAICNHYINKARHYFKDVIEECNDIGRAPIEQRGMLIADVWQKGRYHTFLITDWYDQLSCGNNIVNSYITVDSSTGKEIGVDDLIEDKNMVLNYLRTHDEGWIVVEGKPDSKGDLLSQLDGCALLEEGLIIYYRPYSIGIGALGEPLFTISYQSLKANGIKLKLPFNIFTKESR